MDNVSSTLIGQGTAMVMIIWQLDLQLPMQSLSITTNVVSDLQQVCGIFRLLRFPPPIKLTPKI